MLKIKLLAVALLGAFLISDAVVYTPKDHVSIKVRFGQAIEQTSERFSFKMPIIESAVLFKVAEVKHVYGNESKS